MRILVVDDEPAVRTSVSAALQFEGYDVALAADGVAALESISSCGPDLLIVDVLMPRLDGLQTVRRLRADGSTLPVLMLTARDGLSERVSGLDAGADDYLVKPFGLEELLARVRALLRRSATVAAQASVLVYDDLTLDLAAHRVTRGGMLVRLTRTEFQLLEMLMRHRERVLSRAQILQDVWGFDFEASSNSLDVYIGYLRRKLEADGQPRLVHTERGVGFVLRRQP